MPLVCCQEASVFYRWFGNHFTLVFVTLGIMVVGAGAMTEQIVFLTAHLETNFIPAEVEMEGNIVILLACFGVFLGHRRYLLDKIYPDGLPESVEQFDHASHHVGVSPFWSLLSSNSLVSSSSRLIPGESCRRRFSSSKSQCCSPLTRRRLSHSRFSFSGF